MKHFGIAPGKEGAGGNEGWEQENRKEFRAEEEQRIATTERIAQDDFQRWLRFLNKEHYEIYVSMNTIRENANGRKKSDIAQIRHVYLDFDVNGTEAVRQMLDRPDMPVPNHLIESSPGKWQAIWRVEGFEAPQAENLMRGMVGEFGADPAAVDSARVLRLPGFYSHKYRTPHFVRVQNLCTDVYTPSQFPGFAIPGLGTRVTSVQHPLSPADKRKLQGGTSQSELDWAYAKRALARGEDPRSAILCPVYCHQSRRRHRPSTKTQAGDDLTRSLPRLVIPASRGLDHVA